MNAPWAVFDLDGCVSDDIGRLYYWDQKQYDAYHSRIHQDPVIKVAYDQIWTWYGSGGAIVFITARPVTYSEETIDWIQANLGLRKDQFKLYMRPIDNDKSSPDLKRDLMKLASGLSFQGQLPDAVFDDRDDVLQMYAEEGIKCIYRMTRDGQERYVPSKLSSGPAERLREGAALFEQRNAVYGDNHLTFGRVAAALWPDGIKLEGEEQFARFGILVQIIAKTTRYAADPQGHVDSIRDMKVYAAMLEDLHNESP